MNTINIIYAYLFNLILLNKQLSRFESTRHIENGIAAARITQPRQSLGVDQSAATRVAVFSHLERATYLRLVSIVVHTK